MIKRSGNLLAIILNQFQGLVVDELVKRSDRRDVNLPLKFGDGPKIVGHPFQIEGLQRVFGTTKDDPPLPTSENLAVLVTDDTGENDVRPGLKSSTLPPL